MAINVNGATPYQPITATKNKQTFKGSDVQSAPEQKEGGNALLWGSIAALGAAGLTYFVTHHFDGKALDAAKTQLKTAQESLGKQAKNFKEGYEALGLKLESSTGKIMQGEAAYSGEVISNGSLRHIIKDGERTKSVMDIVENGTKGTSEMLFSKGENGEKILTQTIKIGDNKTVYQYVKQSDGSYNKLSGSLDEAGKFIPEPNANPVTNAAIEHAPSPAAATDSAALKSAQDNLNKAQADLGTANQKIEDLEKQLNSLEADKTTSQQTLKDVQDELAKAKNDLAAKENELNKLKNPAFTILKGQNSSGSVAGKFKNIKDFVKREGISVDSATGIYSKNGVPFSGTVEIGNQKFNFVDGIRSVA